MPNHLPLTGSVLKVNELQDTQSKRKGDKAAWWREYVPADKPEDEDGKGEADRAMQCFLAGAQIGDDLDSIAVAVHEFYENEFNRVGTAAEGWLKLLVSRANGLMDNAKSCGAGENIVHRWEDFLDAYRSGDWQGMESAINTMGRTMNREFTGHVQFSYG